MTIRLYEVGGCVRDELLGVEAKDVDFAVEAPSFDAMMDYIQKDLGFKVFLSKPEFLTVRAQVRADHKLRERCKDADFVLCRKDGPSTDGRRPDFVEPGTILDDLARRDFTVNAMAKDPFTGELIDPHGGRFDLIGHTLRFVGDPMTRIREDGLRVMRALRFSITKGMHLDNPSHQAVYSDEAAAMLQKVSIERIRDEFGKMLAHDQMATIRMVAGFHCYLQTAIFREGLRLAPTLKQA
jgi:tRNA nucleotidyltransferase/poly(A) polymerase